jgi:ParB family chromosome partitioning protein
MKHEIIQNLELKLINMAPQVRKRVKKEAIEELKRTMAARGQLFPIRVCRLANGYVIVSGHLRFLAARELSWETIASIIEERTLTDAEMALQQLTENLVRVELSPIDAANGLATVIKEMDLKKSAVADATGLEQSRISKLLPLLSLDEETQQKIADGTIPKDTAYHLSRIGDTAMRGELLDKAANGELTRDEASRIARLANSGSAVEAKALTRVKAVLDAFSVTVSGPEIVMDSFVALLEQLLGKARKARAKNIDLRVFIRSLQVEASQ